MILMIGKNLRRNAFAAVIAASAVLIALVFIIGAAFTGAAFFTPSEKKGGASGVQDAEGAPIMKNGGASLYDPARDGEVIRLHIVANSDSSEDQRVKLLVRDEVLALAHLGDDILHPGSLADAESLLKTAGEPLLNAVRSVLAREGASYDAQLILGDFDFPDREYDGKLYPAGKYRALRILLGEAEGKNWWCILFPPLCIIRNEERIKLDNNANSGDKTQTEPERAEHDGCLHFESLLVKLFNKIFNGEA